jgi:anaerobic selenocysteine-containing dehydrogenase
MPFISRTARCSIGAVPRKCSKARGTCTRACVSGGAGRGGRRMLDLYRDLLKNRRADSNDSGSAHMMKTHYRACHLCEAICGLKIETRGEEVLSIKGDPDDPLSRGHICPKAVALKDIHEDPDRLRYPVRRITRSDGSHDWEEISWDEALDATADALLSSTASTG